VTNRRFGARSSALAAVMMLACVAGAGAQAPSTASVAPPATLQEIDSLLARQDVDGAGAAIDAALRRFPADPALHNLAGVVAARRGVYEAARSHFEEAIRLQPRQTAAYENLGRLYQEHSATDPSARAKALEMYKRLLTVDPSSSEGLFQASLLLAIDGKFADSRALIERLPEELRRGSQVLAVMVVDLAGTRDQGASAALADLARHPELTAADVMAVAPAFAHLPDDAAAREMLEALDRRSLATVSSLQALGELHLKGGQYREAIEVLNRAQEKGGTSVPVLIDLARATDKLGDHKGALGYLAHARSLEPQDPNIHFLFAVVCIELDLGAEAYQSMKRAVELAPESPPVNYMMGAVSLHRHEPSEALPYFEKYIQLKPDDPRGRFALGVARFDTKDFDGARRDLETVAGRPETAAGANYFLARIARQSNDLPTARKYLDATLRVNPQYADAWAELGLLQTRKGQYKEAEQSLQKALAIDADNYQATVNLTALFTRTRDPRREEQAARLAALQQKRAEHAQDFIRGIEVVPQ
jgi:tetratricopeptide (TPR) repeat protein